MNIYMPIASYLSAKSVTKRTALFQNMLMTLLMHQKLHSLHEVIEHARINQPFQLNFYGGSSIFNGL